MGLREWVITHSFMSLSLPLRLATDVSSQGLDIPRVDLVVNYDFTYKVYF